MKFSEIKSIVDRFDGFDGAVVQSISFNSQQSISEREIIISLRAFSVSENAKTGWRLVSITAFDHPIFSWFETTKNTNLVLNFPVVISEVEGNIIIDFDPLHATSNKSSIKLSPFFIGARSLSISVVEIESR